MKPFLNEAYLLCDCVPITRDHAYYCIALLTHFLIVFKLCSSLTKCDTVASLTVKLDVSCLKFSHPNKGACLCDLNL